MSELLRGRGDALRPPPGPVPRRPLLLVASAVALAAGCVEVASATPPAIVAKRAQAAEVLAEISMLDQQVNVLSEQYDGARVKLAALRASLQDEQHLLTVAKVQYGEAERRAAGLLVYLYTSGHGSSLNVILGATSLSELLTLSDEENAVSREGASVVAQIDQARAEVHVRVQTLERDRSAAAANLASLATTRNLIERRLAMRRTLLVSVQAQVARLEEQERLRQARLAAQARARLAAEAAARARAEAAARARAEAAAAAAARARAAAQKARAEAAGAATARARAAARKAAAAAALRAATNSSVTTTPAESDASTTTEPSFTSGQSPTPSTSAAASSTSAAVTAPEATTASPVTTTTPAATTSNGSGLLPAGDPQAASIALQYLGVPYVWGGESPSGFDCSGLVSYVYAQLGINLPHHAADQWNYGVPVTRSELQPGDLVFFNDLGHVGIYIGDNEIVDAPYTGAFVRIDSLSQPWLAANYYGARRL